VLSEKTCALFKDSDLADLFFTPFLFILWRSSFFFFSLVVMSLIQALFVVLIST